jgi:hypothetical protein
VGRYHHGVARPQVADRGTALNMEGTYEYIEYAITDGRKGVVLQVWVERIANNSSP